MASLKEMMAENKFTHPNIFQATQAAFPLTIEFLRYSSGSRERRHEGVEQLHFANMTIKKKSFLHLEEAVFEAYQQQTNGQVVML